MKKKLTIVDLIIIAAIVIVGIIGFSMLSKGTTSTTKTLSFKVLVTDQLPEVANAIVVSDNVLLDASNNKYGKVTGVEVKPCEETYFDLKNEKFVKRTINNRNDIYITAEAEVVEHDFGYELGDHKIRIGEKQIVSAPAYGVEGYIVEIFD